MTAPVPLRPRPSLVDEALRIWRERPWNERVCVCGHNIALAHGPAGCEGMQEDGPCACKKAVAAR